jgi:hypothetical protein
LGLISVAALLLAWLANPFMALLLVPIAHVWLLDARRERGLPWPAVTFGALISLLPLAAVTGNVASRLELGSSAPWQLLLMVGDGQIGFGTMLALCMLVGSLIGVVAVAARRGGAGRPHAGRPAEPGAPAARPVPPRSHDLDASPIAPYGAADDLGEGR